MILLRSSRAGFGNFGYCNFRNGIAQYSEIVCYRSSQISYEIAKRVVKNIKYISLVNLIMDKEVVKELIQKELNTENLVAEFKEHFDGKKRDEMLNNFELLREKLGGKGASEHAAEIIVNTK